MDKDQAAVLNFIVQQYSLASVSLGDVQTLCHLCKGQDTVVELGTNIGSTTMFLSQIVTHIITIDVFEDIDRIENEEQRNIYRHTFDINQNHYLEMVAKFAPYKNIVAIKEMSHLAANLFPNNFTDVLFIDADHSYEGAKKDLDAWLPKVKMGGCIILHDVCGGFPGLVKLDKELNENNLDLIPIIFTSIEPGNGYEPTTIKAFEKKESPK